jgi:integral membrane protein
MKNTPLGRFRVIGLIEGISYLVLLGIAMPLKYFLDYPAAVKIAGSLHGLFFVLYILALAHVTFKNRWSIMRVVGAFIASLLPFGNFVLDARLKHEQ